MKRSEINRLVREADGFIRSFGFRLPPFADWTPDDWRENRAKADGIVEAGLGWDVTDYGRGNFDDLGLLLFTLRNGRHEDLQKGRGMLYAEKIMISRRDQLSPMHYHAQKAEDIINRGGGTLVLRLFNAAPGGVLDEEAPVEVDTDGIRRTLAPGDKLKLGAGESVTLLPGMYHEFWAEGGDALIGEVSTVNDDLADNYFLEPLGRFPEIDEDAPPCRLLVGDYAAL